MPYVRSVRKSALQLDASRWGSADDEGLVNLPCAMQIANHYLVAWRQVVKPIVNVLLAHVEVSAAPEPAAHGAVKSGSMMRVR